jgi:hypothetical protein
LVTAEDNLSRKKKDHQLTDIETVTMIKSLIRSSEAKISVESFGMMPNDVYCM